MRTRMFLPMVAATVMLGLIPISATQDQEINSPTDLARLVMDKPAEAAADIAGKLLTEAIRLGGSDREVLQHVVETTAVLMSGVSQAEEEVLIAVAQALLDAAGETYETPVAVTIKRVLQRLVPDWEAVLDAVLENVPEERRPLVARATQSPRRSLGLRLNWSVTRYIDEVMLLLEPEPDPDVALAPILPTTTTTTTSTTTTTTTSTTTTTTTTTTRPSPTPVGRR